MNPQFPTLLSGYPARPSWQVPGVDFAAGHAGATVHPPTAAALPAGVTMQGNTLTISAPNVTLSGLDLTQNGGQQVFVNASGAVIEQCVFVVGANLLIPIPIVVQEECGDLIVRRCTFDGGKQTSENLWATIYTYVYSNTATNLTVEHCWFYNTAADVIEYNSNGTLIVRNNLFNGIGYAPGAHADSVQFTNGNAVSCDICYNTVLLQTDQGALGGEGLQVESQLGTASITGFNLSNNVIIQQGPQGTFGYALAMRNDTGNAYSGVCNENWIDSTGGWGPFYPVPAGVTLAGNVDLVTGSGITP